VPYSRHVQQRTRYARTNQPIGNLLVNAPPGAGIPSGQPPISFIQSGDTSQPFWYWGNDDPHWYRRFSSAMAAVTRATSLIVNQLTSWNWQILSGPSREEATATSPLPRWVADPMLLRPDERFGFSAVEAARRQASANFWAQWVRSALWHGVGYLLYQTAADGSPKPGTMRILNPAEISSRYSEDLGYVVRRIGPEHSENAIETDFAGGFTLGPVRYQLLEILNPTAPVDELGLAPGVLGMHAWELGLAEQALTYATGMYRAGVPSGFLKVAQGSMTSEGAERLKAQWMASHGGDRRSVAVLGATVDFQPIQMSPVDMALVAMRHSSSVDIANMFGVPIYALTGTDAGSNTYSNAESRNQDFVRYTLMPWSVPIQEALSSLLPQGQWLNIDFRSLLRADTATRFATYAAGISSGVLTKNEAREWENLPPLPEPEPVPVPPQLEIVPPMPEEVPA
jgi:phage portal protein BeeE